MRHDGRMPDRDASLVRHLWWRVQDYAAVLRWQAASSGGPDSYEQPETVVGPPVVAKPKGRPPANLEWFMAQRVAEKTPAEQAPADETLAERREQADSPEQKITPTEESPS